MADFEGSGLVNVKYPDHSKAIVEAFRNLFDSKRGTDFDLRWGGCSVRAHKTILELFLAPETIGSNVAQQLGSPTVKEEVPDHVHGRSSDILYCLLEFLYKGEVAVPKEQLEGLLRVAKELDFQMLVDAIAQSCYSKSETVESVPIVAHSMDWPANIRRRSVNPIELEPEVILVVPHSSIGVPSQEEGLNVAESMYGDILQDGNEENGQCLSSGNEFYSNFNLEEAERKVSKDTRAGYTASVRTYACQHCVYSGHRKSDLDKHLVVVHGKGVDKFVCHACNIRFKNLALFQRHLRIDHVDTAPALKTQRNVKVEGCTNAIRLSSWQHHPGSSLQGIEEEGIKSEYRKFKCPHCSYCTDSRSMIKSHCLDFHGPYDLKNVPGANANYSADYSEEHPIRFNLHPGTSAQETKGSIASGLNSQQAPAKPRRSRIKKRVGRFDCFHCSFPAHKKTELEEHILTIQTLSDNRYLCPHCCHSTRQHSSLKKHLRISHIIDSDEPLEDHADQRDSPGEIDPDKGQDGPESKKLRLWVHEKEKRTKVLKKSATELQRYPYPAKTKPSSIGEEQENGASCI